jgi:molybdate transport system substrate-binding protein
MKPLYYGIDMRRMFLVLMAAAACSSSKRGDDKAPVRTIRVAAASDLARAFGDVGRAFTAETGITPVFDFGSSGLLAKQIEQGAPFQLFAAANRNFADQVVKAGKCDSSTLALYSRGRVIAWGKAGSPTKLADLADPKYKRIGIANPDHAPYGKAAVQAMQKAGIYDAVKDRLVLAENVQQAFTYAQEGSVDVSFAALSLGVASGAKDYLAVELDLHDPLEQTLVVCGAGPQAEAGRELAAFIVGDKGRAIMEGFGFSTTGVVPQKQ